jgi:hypothetical protein
MPFTMIDEAKIKKPHKAFDCRAMLILYTLKGVS